METFRDLIKSPPGIVYCFIVTAAVIFWILSFMVR